MDRNEEDELDSAKEQVARLTMAFDMVHELIGILTEESVIDKIFILFSKLFAPRSIIFKSLCLNESIIYKFPRNIEIDEKIEAISINDLGESELWRFEENNLYLGISFYDRPLGILLLQDLAFSEHIDKYIYPALIISKVCGLAISNARIHSELQESLLKVKVSEKKLRDLNRNLEKIVEARTNDLKVKMEELKRSNKELEQFAYVASHDLQEPLRMVASFTQLLQIRYQDKLDDDANDFIKYAVDGAIRMQNLISDLLIFSRVGSRGKPFKTTDMNVVLEAAINILRQIIEKTDTKITYKPLPVILADESQIIQLLQNLISNAIKFRSEEPPCIHISGEVKADKWIFSVSDNGIGMESKYFDRIFVIFQRLHKRDKYGGTGIGLAVCKKIIQRHSGKIWVESELGKGSSFHFTIKKHTQDRNSV